MKKNKKRNMKNSRQWRKKEKAKEPEEIKTIPERQQHYCFPHCDQGFIILKQKEGQEQSLSKVIRFLYIILEDFWMAAYSIPLSQVSP